MEFKKRFSITGVATDIALDEGLESTATEPKRLLYVAVQTNGPADNTIEGWLEREKVFDIPDKLVDFEADDGATDLAKPANRITEINVNVDMAVGQVFKVGIRCGATNKDLEGFYAYEIIK